MYQTILLSVILAGTATAAPKALPAPDVGPILYCPPIVTSYNEQCNIETDATVSLSNTITEGASLTLDLPEIGSIAFSPSVSQTFTHGTGTTIGQTCPPGDYSCGIASAAPFHVVSGVKTVAGGGSDGDCHAAVNSPYSTKVPAQDGTSIRWYLCIAPTSANQTLIAGMVMC